MKLSSILDGAKLLFSLSIILIFSTTIFAQLNDTTHQQKINFYSEDKNIGSKLDNRPRINSEPAKTVNESAKPKNDASVTTKKTISTLELERQAFELLNQKRIQSGLSPVVWNEEVAKVARLHSQNMANNNFFSHQGLDGLTVDDRADASGLNWRRIGENIAYNRGYDNPVEFAVLRWMQSQSHRENLLNNKWKESGVGIAIAPDGKTYYFTQVFVLRK